MFLGLGVFVVECGFCLICGCLCWLILYLVFVVLLMRLLVDGVAVYVVLRFGGFNWWLLVCLVRLLVG